MATFNGTYTSTDGKYSVAIEENGKIEVKKGDWLSKYSAALYGDPHKVENVYGSLVNRELVVINIVDELEEGEFIYHIDTYKKFMNEQQKNGGLTRKETGDRKEDGEASNPEEVKEQKTSLAVLEQEIVSADNYWADHGENSWPKVRSGNEVKSYVDGKDMMVDLARDIRNAKQFIYMTDWAMTAEYLLERTIAAKTNKKAKRTSTLINLLKQAAVRGVKVRIMLWDSNNVAPGPDVLDTKAEDALEKAHNKIRVSRHSPSVKFSHHQKSVVIDSNIAYVGGLDIYDGRWDTKEHHLDANRNEFFGDFYNPCIKKAKPASHPRMPWHDVHIRIKGAGAFDVERNFVERWNFQRKNYKNEDALSLSQSEDKLGQSNGKQMVQICRSACKATTGRNTETSIQQAYIRAIKNSKHYIYIENQFLTSHFGTSTVQNRVAEEIAKRIIIAHKKKQKFRVIIVLPVFPEGILDDWSTQELFHWQYESILGDKRGSKNNAKQSLIQRLLKEMSESEIQDYIGFFNLRHFGKVGGNYVTEQVYVHSKLMIVDDRVVIVGSANINDRSLIGERDSELSAVVIDKEIVDVEFGGSKQKVRKFAHELRIKLWQEHLGEKNVTKLKDAISDATWMLINKRARSNRKIYEAVFPNIPSDNHEDLDAQNDADAFVKKNESQLHKIKGFIITYPLYWLKDEDLETSGISDDIMVRKESSAKSKDKVA